MILKPNTPKSIILFIAVVLFAIITSLFFMGIIGSWLFLALIIVTLLPICWLLYLLLVPKEFGKTRYRRVTASLLVVISPLAVFIFNNLTFFSSAYVNTSDFLLKYGIPLITRFQFNVLTTSLIILILLHAANFFLQDKSVMKEHDNSFNELFPERDFNLRLKSFCNYLRNRIDIFDNEANWSDAHFTSIDAEVETYTSRGKKNNITNLIKAIKNNYQSKVFLVLGEPGSGKSVALRKLCRDLINEVISTRKIPIYLNLKEWSSDFKWTEENPPKPQDLYDFCLSFLKGKDIFADNFIDKYFKTLYENGHVFFIIDSFDEIPAVLDVDESSWLIDKLSDILYSFLGGAHESRGILASRHFRKPTDKFKAFTTLNLRPFTHFKINQALRKYIIIDDDTVKEIFSRRTDLLPIASNPFAIGLIYSYLKDNGNKLPKGQGDLYHSYIESRLSTANNLIKKADLDQEQVKNYAIEIASYMLNKISFGLEAPLDELREKFSEVNIDRIIDILVYCRIGRIGKGEENRFSFVHRRFNEYFIVQKYLSDPSMIDLNSIPVDSKFRDSMVLYCEIAPDETATEIAEFCWSEIKLIRDKEILQFKRSIHCLRFLVEAYRLKTHLLISFKDDLSNLIKEIINNYEHQRHPLLTKIAVEATGILEQREMHEALFRCFATNNWWIEQTAVQSCKFLSSISKTFEDRIVRFVFKKGIFELVHEKAELLFLLSLSEPFKTIRKLTLIRYYDSIIFMTFSTIAIVLNPSLAIIVALYYASEFISVHSSKSLFSMRQLSRLMVSISALSLPMYLKFILNSNRDPSISWHHIMIAFILFPFLDIYILLTIDREFLRKYFLNKRMIYTISFQIVIGLLVIALTHYIENVPPFIGIGVAILIGAIFLWLFSIVIYELLKDYFRLKSIFYNVNLSRGQIAADYDNFKTEYFKKKYVLSLQINNSVPQDMWPENFILTGRSNSRILLSQLDEKWLGLN